MKQQVHSTTATKQSSGMSGAVSVILFMSMLMACDVALAAGGNPVQAMLDGVIAFLNSGVMRSIAILAVIGMGVAAYLGKISWEMAMRAGAGIILTFGAAALVDQFSGYVG